MPPQSASEEFDLEHSKMNTRQLDGDDEKLPAAEGPLQLSSTVPDVQKEATARSVRFSSMVKIQPVLSYRDMSTDEINQAWVSGYEKKENRRAITSTVYLMKAGVGAQRTEDDDFCERGLEHLVDKYRTERIKKSLGIALAMQRLLRRAGASNPDMIAKAYRTYTLRSQKAAYRKAVNDQAAVQHRQPQARR
jgi:hypothetical protein